MVVHRRPPTELPAEAPAAVYALNLGRLSELLSIPEEELVTGFQSRQHVTEMHGVVVDAGEDVPFEAVGHQRAAEIDAAAAAAAALASASDAVAHTGRGTSFIAADAAITMTPPPPSSRKSSVTPGAAAAAGKREHRRMIRQVLLTAAARPSSLDSDELPKCLIPLGSQTIIAHILTQLYAAGVDRVVISVAAGGSKIIQAVQRTPFYNKMVIEFLDLGPDNREGHARSILAARSFFPHGPFLIHTADHIFDKSIITKFMHHELNENVACVLVETDVNELVGLPPTTVKVQLGPEKIKRIGRDLEPFDGIDAGLFLSSVAIFDALEELATKKAYFSLADALNFFTKYNKLTYMSTAGETWFSIETEEQLAYTQDNEGIAVLSPWTVFLATAPAVFQDDPMFKKNVVIGISAPEHDASLRVAGATDPSRVFDGFIVGVANADRPPLSDGPQLTDGSVAIDVGDATPLLPLSRRSMALSSTHSHMSRAMSFIERGTVEESFVISFPMDDETSQSIDNLSASRHAYLIEMNPDPMTPIGTSSQFMLAVPGTRELMASPAVKRREILPSDIEQISLETRGCDEHLEVTVVVKRKVPFIGYLLLLTSLLTISSVGVALDIVDNVAPLLKLFWRQMGTCITSFLLAALMIHRNGGGFPRFTWDTTLAMLVTGFSYSFYLASYVISLSMTSVGHATLFNNAHSLLIVFVKLFLGQPVALFEGAGAAVGVLGGAVTTMDAAQDDGSNGSIIAPSAFGDLVALAGAIGGAAYFINAKKVRPKMDLLVFLCCLTGTSAICLFVTMLLTGEHITLSMDVNHGLFGWLNPQSDRLLVEFYLVFVCDLVGTMGYISVLKYFDPIVISVVCLVEPVVANVMGILAGVDAIPGPLTLLGAVLVIGGTILVITTQDEKTEAHDATDAIKGAISSTPTPLYSSRLTSSRVSRRTFNYGSVN